MSITIQHLRILVILPLLTFCGGGPTIQMNLTGATAFADPTVRDIVFVFQSQAASTGILDQDNNGQPDFFVYPEACGAAVPAGCGAPPTTGTITVGVLPLDFSYTVSVLLRSAAGGTLYNGQATFSNVENAAAVNVVVD